MVEVIAWAKSHRQIHWADVGTGAEGQNPPGAEPTSPPSIAVVHERDVTFSLPARGRAFQSRQVLVSVSPSGKHEVTLRVDAQVVWIPTRETWSYVPRAVSFATATVWNGAGRTSTTIATSSNRSEVAKLRRLVNAMPVATSGVTSCPAESGQQFRLEFGGAGAVYNLAGITGECGGIGLSVAGQGRVLLVDPGGRVFAAVEALADAK